MQKPQESLESCEIVLIPKLSIEIPSPEEEFNMAMWYISRIPWYKEKGYKIENVWLPKHPVFQYFKEHPEEIEQLSKSNDEQVSLAQATYEEQEYLRTSYEVFLAPLLEKQDAIQEGLKKLSALDRSFYKIFPEYRINLTKYGMGGSYDHRDGKIGKVFLRCENQKGPRSNVIIILHEIIHIGIEESIVETFNLNQSEKERVVDLIGKFLISDPYLQPIGDKRIDEFLNESTVYNLPEAISRYVKKYPRSGKKEEI